MDMIPFLKKKPIPKTIKKLNLQEVLDLFILLIPYLGFVKEIKKQYQKQDGGTSLYIVISTLLDTLNKDDLYKITGMLFDCDIEAAAKISIKDVIAVIPKTISENNLLEVYVILKNFGLLE